MDRPDKQFSCYILPNASKVNKRTVKTVNGIGRHIKDNRPVEALELSQVLTAVLNFFEGQHRFSFVTIHKARLHNAATFDIPILLRNGGEDFIAELSSISSIRFADTLTLLKSLIKSKHSSLQNAVGQYPKPGQSSVYEHLFQTTFDAHDALEDVIALRRILFSSKLALSDEMLVNRSSVISVKDAAEDLKYLDNRHQRVLSFRGKLYNPGHAGSPIKQGIAVKIAGSGLAYEDLKSLYLRFGRKGLVCILTRPPLSTRSTLPRVTNTTRKVSAILKHFEEISKDSAT